MNIHTLIKIIKIASNLFHFLYGLINLIHIGKSTYQTYIFCVIIILPQNTIESVKNINK